MGSPPRHHQFREKEREETAGEAPKKKLCPQFNREKEKRKE